jgi:thiol-disulfide isomerase/thioredoxin
MKGVIQMTQQINGLYFFLFLLLITTVLLSSATPSVAELEQCGKLDPAYQADPDAVAILKQVAQPTEIVLFYGTWCKDSHREIPRFLKIMELAENPNLNVTEYEVNREKKDVLGKFEMYGIEFVPTFIVIRNGRELGRIVETPNKSLAEDLAAIMSSRN